MDWGAAAEKRTARTTSQAMTAITTLLNPMPSNLSRRKRPSGAEREPCALKNRREALDTRGSFRDGDTLLVCLLFWPTAFLRLQHAADAGLHTLNTRLVPQGSARATMPTELRQLLPG